MSTFNLKVVASNKVFFDGACKNLILPMVDGGTRGFLAHHENIVAPVEIGEMTITTATDEKIHAFVGNGFMEFLDNSALVVCVSVELPEEIDVRRAPEAEHRAREKLRQKQSIVEHRVTESDLSRAMYRLKMKGKY